MTTITLEEADPSDRPLSKNYCFYHCNADSGNRQQVLYQNIIKLADVSHRPLYFSVSHAICTAELADDGKLGFRFTPANELEEIDIGPGDRPRPMYISQKLQTEAKS